MRSTLIWGLSLVAIAGLSACGVPGISGEEVSAADLVVLVLLAVTLRARSVV
jgi:hypothetical protein